jgi:hypothetical protein
VRADPILDDTFYDFGDEIQVGYGTIAAEIFLWKRLLFEKRANNGCFVRRWEPTFC